MKSMKLTDRMIFLAARFERRLDAQRCANMLNRLTDVKEGEDGSFSVYECENGALPGLTAADMKRIRQTLARLTYLHKTYYP